MSRLRMIFAVAFGALTACSSAGDPAADQDASSGFTETDAGTHDGGIRPGAEDARPKDALSVDGSLNRDGSFGVDGSSSDRSKSDGSASDAAHVDALAGDAGHVPLDAQPVADTGSNVCNGVTCSGHGTCLDVSGTATCACEAAHVPVGLECLLGQIVVTGRGMPIPSSTNVASTRYGTDFGNLLPGTSASETFTITNTGSAPIRLDNVWISDDASGFLAIQTPAAPDIPPSGSVTFTVAFAPGREGSFRGRVNIQYNAAASLYVFAVLGAGTYFPTFADPHTVALWTFDERPYGLYTSLLDASANELDLLMMEEGSIAPGVFGNALRLQVGSRFHISYAGWQGDMVNEHMRLPDGTASGQWAPTVEPWPLINTLVSPEFTFEFWYRAATFPAANSAVFDLGDALQPGVSLHLLAGSTAFLLQNFYGGLQWTIPCDTRVVDGAWRHVAFVRNGNEVRLYVDGNLLSAAAGTPITAAPLPPVRPAPDFNAETRGFTPESPEQWRRENRFNVSLGEDRNGGSDLDGFLDEMRFSSVPRYGENFALPGTLARNLGASAPRAATPSGPPLLFPNNNSANTTPLGDRKHLFIDDVLVDERTRVDMKVNQLRSREDLVLLTATGPIPFAPKRGGWKEMVFEHEGVIYVFVSGNYSSSDGNSFLYASQDGIHFTPVNVGVHNAGGSTQNNFVFHQRALGAYLFKDRNPNISPEERFKITAFAPARGMILYVSPDMLHWRRNEVIMLPLMAGGEPESFYDDQRGSYSTIIKRDSGARGDSGITYRGRRGMLFESTNAFTAWPMQPVDNPYYEGWPIPTITNEGPLAFAPIVQVPLLEEYDVFRSRPHKYEWAPDTYVAFPWLGYHNYADANHPDDKRRRVRLSVSRDGRRWKYYEEDWFMDNVGDIDGIGARDVQSFAGIIRRGDELWMYAEYSTEPNGDGAVRFSRLRTKIDRFASLHPKNEGGVAITKPFTFTGRFLELNVLGRSSGSDLRVGILDDDKDNISGFRKEDADVIRNPDSTAYRVTWRGNGDVSGLQGRPVRLYFELDDVDVFGFQFVP